MTDTEITTAETVKGVALKQDFERKELLSRKEASQYSRLIGIPYAVSTLAKLACIGGGPEMTVCGRRVFYRPSSVRSWLKSMITVRASTSEAAS